MLLMDMDFAVLCPLVPHRMPLIRFLFIGSRFCSTLLSDSSSRSCPCASLSLHLHQVVKRTFTFQLSIMLGTHSEVHRLKAVDFRAGFEKETASTISIEIFILPFTQALSGDVHLPRSRPILLLSYSKSALATTIAAPRTASL